MKNRLNMAVTCLFILSFFNFIGIIFNLLNYATFNSSSDAGLLNTFVIPSIPNILLGIAFQVCAKRLKNGEKRIWLLSIVLNCLMILYFLINFYLTGLPLGAFVLVVALLGIWALLHKTTRGALNV